MTHAQITIETIDQNSPEGSRSQYLAQLASDFPERDSLGYIIGHYVYDADKRIAGPYPCREAAELAIAEHPRRSGSWSIVCGHVFTASHKVIRVGA